jgi:hypothetical protein
MKALVITGSMGSGKTKMLANDGTRRVTDVAGEILQRAGWGGP